MTETSDGEQDLPDALRAARFLPCDIYEAPGWYDVDYAGYRGEEAFYRLVSKPCVGSGELVVELGAGTGRLTLPLAREGLQMMAVEPAAAMRARLEERVLAEAGVAIEVCDGRAADFHAEREAALVIFPFNGMLHLRTEDEVLASFANIRDQLSAGGRFAFDVTGPYWDAIAYGPVPWGRVDERIHPTTGKKVFTADRSRYAPATRTMHIDIRYLIEGESEGAQVALVQRMWTYQQLLAMVLASGFSIELLFGDVDMSPFHDGAVRMLLTAKKR